MYRQKSNNTLKHKPRLATSRRSDLQAMSHYLLGLLSQKVSKIGTVGAKVLLTKSIVVA